MKRAAGYLCILVTLMLSVGCEWETSGSDDSWDSSVGWVNFSGVYRAVDGGVIVSDFTRSQGSTPTETLASMSHPSVDNLHVYQGVLNKVPISPGSVTFDDGAFHFQDDGNGNLAGSVAGTSGTVNYDTGAWQVNLGALELPNNTDLVANWTYLQGGTGNVVEPGNTGDPIYSFTIEQVGNKLRIIASSGTVLEGQMALVETAGGDPSGATSGDVIASFEVKASGVTMSGSFRGTYTAPAMDTSTGTAIGTGTLTARTISGTWVETNGQTGNVEAGS